MPVRVGRTESPDTIDVSSTSRAMAARHHEAYAYRRMLFESG